VRSYERTKSAYTKLISFESVDMKEWPCDNTYKLRNAGKKFNNVYLNEDRTKIQRALDKQRRDVSDFSEFLSTIRFVFDFFCVNLHEKETTVTM